MKNLYNYILVLAAIGFLVLAPAPILVALENKPDIDIFSKKFAPAIQQIIDCSDQFQSSLKAIEVLENPNKITEIPLTGFRVDTIFTQPEIAFAQYDQTSITFNYYPEDTFYEDSIFVTFPDSPGWLHNPIVDSTNSTITITIEENPGITPRVASILIEGTINSNSVSCTAFVLQAGKPQQFILVSPKYLAVSPEGGITDPFAVTHFNVIDWEAIIDDNWILVEEQTPDAIIFHVEINDTGNEREANIVIQEVGNSNISDTLTIFQYVDTSEYIIVTPQITNIGPDANSVTLDINTNIEWEFIPDPANPIDMITNVSIPQDSTSITFGISENTSDSSRTAAGIIKAKYATSPASIFHIIQDAAYAYIILDPGEKLVPFNGETFSVSISSINVDSIVADSSEFIGDVTIFDNDSLQINFPANDDPFPYFDTLVVYSESNPDVSDTLTVIQYAAPESYILIAPRSDTVQFYGDDSVTFNVTTNNLSGDLSIIDSIVPEWILASLNGNQLLLDVQENPDPQTRDAAIYVFDSGNTDLKDSVAIYQYARPEKYILAEPREQSANHAGDTLYFDITPVNVDNWDVDQSTIPEGWIYEKFPFILYLDIPQNDLLEIQTTTIRIYDPEDETVEDFVTVYQYSGLDQYILAEPREQESLHVKDTLTFEVTAVNLSAPWIIDTIAGGDYIDEILEYGDNRLKVAIRENTDPITRVVRLRLYSQEHPGVVDSVSIYQYSAYEPYIIINPTFKRFDSSADTLNIYTFSNLDSYSVSISPDEPQPPDTTWYSINKNSGSFNDSLELVVTRNKFAFAGRSSYLVFSSPENSFINHFYFQQRNDSLNFISISGIITRIDNETPVDSVTIYVDQDTLLTNQEGFYIKENLGYGWAGLIRPEKSGYFFDPPNAVYNESQTEDIIANFYAIPIEPEIKFNIEADSLTICLDEQIDLSSPDYPSITETGTFGAKSYKWFAIPNDPNINTDSSSAPANQIFKPKVTTTYYLVLYNYNTSDTTYFTIEVNPKPEARNFDGLSEVCRNQGGVIYSVFDFEQGEYFQWELSKNDSVIRNYTSNITTINWWNIEEGAYELTLYTFNSFGCSNALTKTITVTNEDAPPKSVVSKKPGDNTLVCVTSGFEPESLNYKWGFYEIMKDSLGKDTLLNMEFIPNRSNWHCRLPSNYTFDPLKYFYFVETSFKNGSSCKTVSFLNENVPVSIVEIDEVPFTIFPNPTTGSVWLRFKESIVSGEVKVFTRDLTGQLVAEEIKIFEFSGDMILVESTKQLHKGIYFIEVQVEGSRFNTKIVVQ